MKWKREATMPDSVPARQVRLGNKKVRFIVKKRLNGIKKHCLIPTHTARKF